MLFPIRHLPEDDEERQALKSAKIQPWQLELLSINPPYVSWGPGEDYMVGSGWMENEHVHRWTDCGLALNDLNEVVHFYFYLDREHPRGAIRVGLVLWILHPRKGASRGFDIKHVEQDDLPYVFAFLRLAAERNAQRFAKVPR